MTRYAVTDRYQWLYSSNVNGKATTSAHGGEPLTGIAYPNDWLKVTTGRYTGSWVWKASPTPTPKPVSTDVTRWTTTSTATLGYASPSVTSAVWARPGLLTPVVGDYYANGWFQARTGMSGWMKDTTATNPYNAIETQQWHNTSGFHAMAPTSATVTRYVIVNRTTANVRSAPAYSAAIAGQATEGTAVTGHFVNSHFFAITAGPYAGRYISSGVLFTLPDQGLINGKLTTDDLCAVPAAMRVTFNASDQWMGCEALHALSAESTFQRSKTPYTVKFWEGYRSLATQERYWVTLGPPTAAKPGTSNHGLGNALDLRYTATGVLSWTSPEVVALLTYGPSFGWFKPAHLFQRGSAYGEPWHFELMG